MRLLIILVGTALALAGCATTPEPAPLAIDTYCASARKIRWSVEDTPETVRQIEVHNRTIDQRCGVVAAK